MGLPTLWLLSGDMHVTNAMAAMTPQLTKVRRSAGSVEDRHLHS